MLILNIAILNNVKKNKRSQWKKAPKIKNYTNTNNDCQKIVEQTIPLRKKASKPDGKVIS